jgi:Domain of unknown function (DUF4279)
MMNSCGPLRIHGPDPGRVTTALGIEPTEADHSWRLVIPPVDGTEFDISLPVLLASVEPAHEALEELRRDGYAVDFFCYLGSYGTEHAAVLRPESLKRIANLGAELWLDVYEEESPADR